MEAAGGFEPPNGGFADPCLTTWLRRLEGTRRPFLAEGPLSITKMERETGFEPATSTLARLRSTN